MSKFVELSDSININNYERKLKKGVKLGVEYELYVRSCIRQGVTPLPNN